MGRSRRRKEKIGRPTPGRTGLPDDAPIIFASCRLLGCALASITMLPAVAVAQETLNSAASATEQAPSQNQSSAPTGDVLNAQSLLQLMYQVKTAPGTGLNGVPDTVTTQTAKIRGDLSVNLDPQWVLALRSDLPFVAKNPVSDRNPIGDYIYGIGDADIQAALIRNIDDRWKVGAGARLVAPTGSATLGSGKWQIMPIFGVRYALPGISAGSYLEPLVRYDVSFAGDPAKRNISNLQLAPMVNVALPDRWFITLYPNPEIRVNFGDPITGQTGRLFLPIDARIGHKLSENFNVSLEVSVPIIKSYPVYNFLTALRFNLTF